MITHLGRPRFRSREPAAPRQLFGDRTAVIGDPIHQRMQRLVGERFDYLDEAWVLIEVLSDIDCIVLQRCAECNRVAVQPDLYGMPRRRVDGTMTLRISGSDGEGYSDDVLVLLEGRRRG